MKYVISIVCSLAVVGATFFVLNSGKSEEESAPGPITDNREMTSADTPQLVYQTEAQERYLPNGEFSGTVDHEVPYMRYGDELVLIFPVPDGIRIDYDLASQDHRFFYFSKGNGKDASVVPYIFNVNDRTLHKVCLDDGTITGECVYPYQGFSSQNDIEVEWEGNNLLQITYENRMIVPGGTEDGPVYGTQIYRSISAEEPWITALTTGNNHLPQ